MSITKYVHDWFERADEDLKVAEILMKETGNPNPVCFHSQQAAEKYLKGFLAYHEKHIRKVHDLKALLAFCIQIDSSFEALDTPAAFLDQFYIETRYPGDIPEFTLTEARKAYEAAKFVKEFILGKIKA